ncbi:hypothetical protein DL98DRAFT_539256 [Cadophora sp. DSE1049]|nr:hypothetical protein DL98DRAFT_539256 [Cadophora sp. DSE1049]
MSHHFRPPKEHNNSQHTNFDHEYDEQHTQSTQHYQTWGEEEGSRNTNQGSLEQEETRPAKRPTPRPRPSPSSRPASARAYPIPQSRYGSTSESSPSVNTRTTTPEPDDTPIVYSRTAEGRWLCTRPPCKDTFAEKSGVKRHVRTVHEGARDYECEICHQTFSDPRRRIGHLKNLNPKYKDCRAAWDAGTVPGAPGYVAPLVTSSLSPSYGARSVGVHHSVPSRTYTPSNYPGSQVRDEEYSNESGRYLFDPLAPEEQQKSNLSRPQGPATGRRFIPQLSSSDEDTIHPAGIPNSIKRQEQGQTGVNGRSSKTESVQPSSQPFDPTGDSYTGPLLLRSQPSGQFCYVNKPHGASPHAGQADKADRPVRSSSFPAQIPNGVLSPTAPYSMARSTYQQSQQREIVQTQHRNQYSSVASAQTNTQPSTAGFHRPRHQGMVQQSYLNQYGGAPFFQPNQNSYTSKSPEFRYQGAVQSQPQNRPYSGTPTAQVNLNPYTSSSQEHQRHSYVQGQRYTSPHSRAHSSTLSSSSESLSYTETNTGSNDESTSTSRALGKRNERDLDDDLFNFNSISQTPQQALTTPSPVFDSYSGLDAGSPRVDNSPSTSGLGYDESLGSDPSDESEADDRTSTHGSGADDAPSAAVPSVRHPSLHIPPVISVSRHGRYRAKKSTVSKSWDEGEWSMSLESDGPLEAWRKMAFGGK